MIMSLIAIAIVALCAYIWLTRGFYSALLNMVCVVIAGAVAFAVWEPLAYLILERSAARPGLAADVAWGAALGLPFAGVLALLRGAVDGLLRKNVICDDVVNYVGGGICGAIAGVLVAGICTISIGMLRLPTDFLGYRPVYYTPQALGRGSLQRTGGLWLPVDKITAGFYGMLSEQAFRTREPLAKWYPNLHEVGPLQRVSYGQGKARNTLTSKDFSIIGRYTVGNPNGPNDPTVLFADSWDPNPQKVLDLDGKTIGNNARVEGFKIRFGSGAKEKSGQVVIGNSQVRLLCESTQDPSNRITVHPFAVASLGDAAARDGKPVYGRFRYDGNEVFIASVGGASEVVMGFEFAVPLGYQPVALYVKNVRAPISGGATEAFPTPEARDLAIRSGTYFSGSGGGSVVDQAEFDLAGARRLDPRSEREPSGISVSNAIGMTIQKGTERTLRINDEDNRIIDGEAEFNVEEIRGKDRGLERPLRIEHFAVTPTIVLVKVDVSLGQPGSLLGPVAQSADPSDPIRLYDKNGNGYDIVGFIYEDASKIHVRYTLGQPLRGMGDLPAMSRSRPEQKLTLIFSCSRNVELVRLAIGKKSILEFSPPLKLDVTQR